MVGLINILTGFVSILAVFQLLYWTGRLSGKWQTDRDEWDEKDYLGKGFAIWMVISISLVFCWILGKVIMHFV